MYFMRHRMAQIWRHSAVSRTQARMFNKRTTYQRFGDKQAVWQTRRFWYTTGTGTVCGAVYYRSHLEDSPTGRRRFINVTPSEESQLGASAYLQTLNTYKAQLIPRTSPISQYVHKVALRIIRASNLPGSWEIHVINSREQNAFVLPGNKIFVFSGLLNVAQTEDALATVLAHEIAHVYARHSAEKLSAAKALQILYMLVSLFVDAGAADIGRSMATLLVELPNSRQCEQEADEIGLEFMARACYDPQEAVGLWQRMQENEQMVPQLLSTHPSTAKRIENIQNMVPNALLKREAANCPSRDHTQTFFKQLGL
ncbi:metalloendopeptidase [Coemansia sp. RSA 1822]|nr:metalloendopeptidase [Coemansia sp. RSA 638]KAJ2120550.1 metalloendopeptidase [Coemansia sp. RSA 720]KAJ2539999.1 metalloendopeptidase [Coemansia sp. RSA 1853]KAJ2560266.1 metalloendopeptidase [Coemansia sp. RSA 1822]